MFQFFTRQSGQCPRADCGNIHMRTEQVALAEGKYQRQDSRAQATCLGTPEGGLPSCVATSS